MSTFRALLFVPMLASVVYARNRRSPPLAVVPDVDLARYMGTWYEIAAIPFRFQAKCASDVTATYTLLDDGNVRVVNRCRMEDGAITEATGLARRASREGPSGKLKVRSLRRGCHSAVRVGRLLDHRACAGLQHVAVGVPDRKYLWILSRTPSMDEATLQRILDAARAEWLRPERG